MLTYVATDLSQREFDPAVHAIADDADVRLDGRVYRQFDQAYYAYLRGQMARVKQAREAGHLEEASYQLLADRFNALHAVAVAHFGEADLRTALRAFNAATYQAPGSAGAVIDVTVPLAETPARQGQGALAGFAPAVAPFPASAPVALGQRLRTAGITVIVTGYAAPDADFPGGYVDVRRDDGVTGQADLRFCRDANGQRLVPMVLTPDEQRAASLPDDPTPLTHADLGLPEPLPPHAHPAGDADPALRFLHPVSAAAVRQVDAIRDAALALGWTEAQLYQNRGRFTFPCGQDYGVVCHLARGARVGLVTAEAIEIVPADPSGAVLKVPRSVPGQPALW
jgi:hypothetical protein